MFIQIDSKTHIRKTAISMVTFGGSSAMVHVDGSQSPVRVTSHQVIEFLHSLVSPVPAASLAAKPDVKEAAVVQEPVEKKKKVK